MNAGFDNLFGIFSLACGAYLLFAYYQLKFKRIINKTVMLPKDVNPKKCKDTEAYCKEMELPTLILTIVILAYGAVDIYNTQFANGSLKMAFMVMMTLVFLALAGFAMRVKQCNTKYFGVK